MEKLWFVESNNNPIAYVISIIHNVLDLLMTFKVYVKI